MKTLKTIEHYLISQPFDLPPIVSIERFREDGINLTIDEGLFLGSLEYRGLQGKIPIMEGGVPKYLKVHPFIEACYEFLLAEVTMKKYPEECVALASILGITVEEFKEQHVQKSKMAKVLIDKLGVPFASIQAAINRGHGII